MIVRRVAVSALTAAMAAGCDSSGGKPPAPSTSVSTPASTSVSPSSPAPASPTPVSGAQAWTAQVAKDLGPLVTDVVPLFRDAESWSSGSTVTAAQLRAKIADAMPDLRTSLTAIRKRAALPGSPEAVDDYRIAILLYLAAFRAEYTATGLPDGALRTQLQNSFTRLRLLGDRIYDQGTARLGLPGSGGDPSLKPAPVPDWKTQKLEPGPPLLDAAVPAAPAAAPDGSTQAVPAWVAAVQAAKVPGADVLKAAFADHSGAKARGAAADLLRAAGELAAAPAPAGEPVAGPLTRLSLLTDAEAGLALAAAGQPGLPGNAAAALRTVATIAALAGNRLWDTGLLGARPAPVTGDAYGLAADAPLQ